MLELRFFLSVTLEFYICLIASFSHKIPYEDENKN